MLAVGIDQADRAELYGAVTDSSTNLLYTTYPAQLSTLQSGLAGLLCDAARTSGVRSLNLFVCSLELDLNLVFIWINIKN